MNGLAKEAESEEVFVRIKSEFKVSRGETKSLGGIQVKMRGIGDIRLEVGRDFQ